MKEYFNVPLKSKVLKGKKTRFNLDLPVYTFQEEGEGTRVLVVIDRVPNADIDSGTLFGDSAAGYAIEKLVYDANGNADSPVEEIAFINYHEFRLNGVDAAMAAAAEADFAARVEKFIGQFKPDVIIAMGRDVANALLDYAGPGSKIDPSKHFGRVIKYPNGKKLAGKKVDFLWTLGIFDFCPDIRHESRQEDMKTLQSRASLAGLILRHFEIAFRRDNINDIRTHDFKTVLVDSLPKFRKMMSKMTARDDHVISIDTEGLSLARIANELISIQFAFEAPDADEDDVETAYFLPMIHPESPWSEDQLEYIQKKLVRFFERGKSTCLVFQNTKFDLTQIGSQTGVRYYNHATYGVDNGEYALEENLKFLGDKSLKHLGVKPYALDFIGYRYGWDAYAGLKVDKSNRTGMREMKTDEFLKYACTDVVLPLRVRRAQIRRAEREGHDPKVYQTAVTGILSDMEQVFSEMERNGHFIDVKYLNEAIRPNGVIDRLRAENIAKYRTSKAAKRANRKLLNRAGAPKKTLFGGGKVGDGKKPWEFAINEVEHQQTLFFDELGIEPLKLRKDGGGSIDKKFLERYGSLDDEGNPTPEYVPEVGWYAEMKKYTTLMTNFVNPINRQLLTDPDALTDGRIRSNFNFRYIITGRSGSSQDRERGVGLNFQNIPNHGKPAKAVKRLFVTPRGFLYIKVDYGAHEVRNWSNVAQDGVLADRFKDALKLKRKFIVAVDADKLDKLLGLLKTRGDIHIQNVKFFFDEWVDKKHPMRQKIKAVVFGVMYGKGAFSLAADIRDTEEAAQALIDKLFGTFREGGDWIQGTINKGRSEYIIDSPFGLKRHLWGHYHPDEGVRRAMDRRGPNCVDLETECLTVEGWKTVDQLRVGELIYTKNIQTGELEAQPLLEVARHKYKGKMWRLDKGIDALVTPNHRWLVDWGKGGNDKWTKKSVVATSEELCASGNNNPIHLVADRPVNQKSKKWTDAEVSIIGWVMSDGHYEKGKNRVRITQSERGNPHKVAQVNKLLKGASKTGPDKLGKIVWTVPTDLAKRVRKSMPDKVLTGEFLNELSTRQLQLLYDALMAGNGNSNKKHGQETFCAGTKEKADMFMMLCVMLGIPCNSEARVFKKSEWQYASMTNVPNPKEPCWYVQIKRRKYSQALSNRNQWEEFDGEVWCPNVKNSTFIARRNGSVYVTGNTIIQGVSSQMGYMAGRNLQTLKWEHFTSKGFLLPLRHDNAVHDSIEMEDMLRTIPVSLYLTEHAMTTQVAKKCRELYDFQLQVDLDVEFELGGTLADMDTWNQRYEDLPALVESKLKWQKDTFGYDYSKKDWKAFIHNCETMRQLRRSELKSDLKEKRYPSEEMLLDKHVVRELKLEKIEA